MNPPTASDAEPNGKGPAARGAAECVATSGARSPASPSPKRRTGLLQQILIGLLAGTAISLGVHAVASGRRGLPAVVRAPWRLADNDPRPLRVVGDSAGALAEIVVHYTTQYPEVHATYRELFRALPADIVVRVAVGTDAEFAAFRALLERWGIARLERFRPVVIHKPITSWSRDRYLLATLPEQPRARVLVVPSRPESFAAERSNDALVPFALARTLDGVFVRTIEGRFDGGDFVAGPDGTVYVTAFALARSREVGGTPRAFLARLRTRLSGEPRVVFGDAADDVPQHHIGMFVTPLQDGRFLLGDPFLGRQILALEAGVPPTDTAALSVHLKTTYGVEVDFRPARMARFERIALELKARGATVVRMPLVPTRASGQQPLPCWLSYNNVLSEVRGGRHHVYLPTYGVAVLDRVARERWESLGSVVHPIDVRGVWTDGGSVRCLVNVIRRR